MSEQITTAAELGAMTRERVAARIWRTVFDPHETMMWSQRGAVPPEIADRCRAAAERLHRDGLLYRPDAPVAAGGSVTREALGRAVDAVLMREVDAAGPVRDTAEADLRVALTALGLTVDGPSERVDRG